MVPASESTALVTRIPGGGDGALQGQLAALARRAEAHLRRPVERVVGVGDKVPVAVGVAGAVAVRVVTIRIHLRQRVGAAGQSIAAVVPVGGLVLRSTAFSSTRLLRVKLRCLEK